MGKQTVTPAWRLAVPASTFTVTYTSTWALSLISDPAPDGGSSVVYAVLDDVWFSALAAVAGP
jgi:hypothetical protein